MTLDLLLIGLAITLEPLPMSAYILILSGEWGARTGLGFVLGWVLTLVGLVVLTLVVTGGKPLATGSAPSTASLVVKILLGLCLLVLAWRTRARRGRPPAPPAWMARLDTMNLAAAMGLGFLLQPWFLVAAGVATVTAADLSNGATVLTLVGFCVLASASYLVMEAYVVLSPAAARERLDRLRSWITVHQDQIVVVVSVALGLWLIGKSSYLLVT
ncbi:GAP family protein [Georgenia ruanii]|uniref:GAP family protein n=1 Tax=Georgenia ruanii TaxID=348442 RepID=A0A7J9UR97_9MICO|nr:GAP family protein [Georgenia ruanii]MPV87136.1 GAP family protein [Georgenia ruanii]